MTIRTYSTRDSATSALRKLGIQARYYNNFITKCGNKFECDLGAASAYLESKTKDRSIVGSKSRRAAKLAAPAKRESISATARALILDGKTNQEVWEVLSGRFRLDDSKRHYPTWYRCEMKRSGSLPKDA